VPIEAGQQLLHYRLIEKIGEGGMGLVWKALDTRLDREVAIKILPDVFAGDAERLARFEREAKLLASLNHPNIAVVHGLDEDRGMRFLVMELVAGEDLSRRLQRGPLPVEEALRVGLQISEALEIAHANGVIHRDLKPANVQLTPTGDVKVLDFGLAKAFDVAGPSAVASMSPTVTSAGTMAGTILGTAAYMSPEQAHGRAVDGRADVWSFGCVLYELLAGERAFTGESISDTLASVLKLEPDHDALPREVPSRVRRLLARCLEKSPRRRLQAIGEARIALEECIAGAPDEVEQSAAPQAAPAARGRTALWIAALFATAVVAIVGDRLLRTEQEPPLRKLPMRAQGAAELDYIQVPLAISPDGRHIAFVSEGKLWIRDLARLEAIEIPESEGATNPFWSPDGDFVGFCQRTRILKVPATGGQPGIITTLKESIGGRASGLAWLPGDRIVYCYGNTISQVSANGGDPRRIYEGDPEAVKDFHNASPLPNGRGVLYMVHTKTGLDTLAVLTDGRQKIIFRPEGHEAHRPVYSLTGHILYERVGPSRGVWAVPFSLAKLEVTGEPFLVAAEAELPSVSRDGTLAYVRGGSRKTELAWFDSTGSVLGSFGEMGEMWPFPAISPDGGRVAVSAPAESTTMQNWDVWVHDLKRGSRTRTTFAESEQGSMAWTPDGEHLIYVSGTHVRDLRLEIARADASGEPRVLWDADECRPGYDWENLHITPDGRFLAYSATGKQDDIDICVLELRGEDARPTPFLHTAALELAPRFHPGGRLMAYQSSESGTEEIYITTFPEGRSKWQVSTGGGAWPRWSADGKKLYYRRQRDLMAVDVETDPDVRLGTPAVLFGVDLTGQDTGLGLRPAAFAVSADDRFLFVRRAQLDRESAADAGIVLVQNWFSEFRDSR
jgi:Tol biopolymer transport system component